MSEINKFRELERKLALELERLDKMKNDKEVETGLEFEKSLKALIKESGLSAKDVIALIDPEYLVSPAPPTSSNTVRKPRELKIYTNPHNGQTVETKGGNHKVLKEWKAEYGSQIVESWVRQ